MTEPNKITGANAGGPRLSAIRTFCERGQPIAWAGFLPQNDPGYGLTPFLSISGNGAEFFLFLKANQPTALAKAEQLLPGASGKRRPWQRRGGGLAARAANWLEGAAEPRGD